MDGGGTTRPVTVEERTALAIRQGLVLVVYGRNGVCAVSLPRGCRIVVGRESPSDVIVMDDSLSRQHASLEDRGDGVEVVDLGSSNGTWVGGERVERQVVGIGEEIVFGGVIGVLHQLREHRHGVESHDAFLAEARREVARALECRRNLALAHVRCDSSRAGMSKWSPHVVGKLRPFDRVGMYSEDTLEILFPEWTAADATAALGTMLAQAGISAAFGVAGIPEHTRSCDGLFEIAHNALARPDGEEPIAVSEDAAFKSALVADDGMVVRSDAMRDVVEMIERLAASSVPVLLLGETGTGKELVARAIHARSRRGDRPLVCVNCGAIPDQLVESTLFGHERGAFTGATRQAPGVFETAESGTLLLDEIAELPLFVQPTLLRVLETKRVARIGSMSEHDVDVRVIAATNRDLEAMCQAGTFRWDLFYRLNVVSVEIPPLRDRREEIEPLCHYFIEQARGTRQILGIDGLAMEFLRNHSWPGNVRELRNVVERAAVVARGPVITPDDLPAALRGLTNGQTPFVVVNDGAKPFRDLRDELRKREVEMILEALRACAWDRARAAERLGLPLRTMAYKMRMHGIRRSAYGRDDDVTDTGSRSTRRSFPR